MEVRKFQVRDVREGLRQIKAELGDDAVILHTAREETGLLEITVGVDEPHTMEPKVESASPAVPAASEALLGMVKELSEQIRSLRHEVISLRRDRDELLAEIREPRPLVVQQQGKPTLSSDALSALHLGIAKLTDDGRDETFARTVTLLYQSLIQHGVLESHVEELVAHAFASQAGWEERPAMLHDLVRDEIEARVDVTDPLWCTSEERTEIVALVGPTGVGKTTTTAKIAAHASRVAHKRVGVICADNFRIGATEQIERYASLLRVPIEFAIDFDEIIRAIAKLRGKCDLIIIDTTGRNPFKPGPGDAIQIDRLHDLDPEEFAVSIHLCLAASTRTEELLAMVEGFAQACPTALLFTKLDEAFGLGTVFSTAFESGLPISHVCNGPMVPNDISGPTAREIATWVSRGNPRNAHSTH
jgi:flagellar biosynthesis protein FlhF